MTIAPASEPPAEWCMRVCGRPWADLNPKERGGAVSLYKYEPTASAADFQEYVSVSTPPNVVQFVPKSAPVVAAPVAAPAGPKADGPEKEEIVIDWSKVSKSHPWLKGPADLPPDASTKLQIIVGLTGNIADLKLTLLEAGIEANYPSWSEVTMAMVACLKGCAGWAPEWIAEALYAKLPCNRHVMKLNGDTKDRAIKHAVQNAHEPPPKSAGPTPEVMKRFADLNVDNFVVDRKGIVGTFEKTTDRYGHTRETLLLRSPSKFAIEHPRPPYPLAAITTSADRDAKRPFVADGWKHRRPRFNYPEAKAGVPVARLRALAHHEKP